MGKVNFKITVNEIEYNCYRQTEGKIKIKQVVYVEGIGYEEDPEEYGYKLPYQDIGLMDYFARRIARSVINKTKNPT